MAKNTCISIKAYFRIVVLVIQVKSVPVMTQIQASLALLLKTAKVEWIDSLLT